MPLLTSTIGAEFTPTKTAFTVESSFGPAVLQHKTDATDPNWGAAGDLTPGTVRICDNPSTTSIYRLMAPTGTVVRAWESA